MKTSLKSLLSVAMVLAFGAVALSAQSCAVVDHASNAAQLSAQASGEAVAAAGASVVGSAQVASGVAAVPVWVSGAAVASGGAVVVASGEAAARAGVATAKGADQLWDFATSDPAKRPALNREVGVPPAKAPASKPRDPTPAEALKTKV